MKRIIEFDAVELPEHLTTARRRVRHFLRTEYAPDKQRFSDRYNPEFSKLCGAAGYIGMTWPKRYGGHEKSFLERYVVCEEMLAAEAPLWAHWLADRQSGAVLLKYACEDIKRKILPKIAAGECFFCVGLSEPDSGSDLFSARASATKTAEGWVLNGTKLWTSGAHCAHYMLALMRTEKATEQNRRHGLTQFLVPMNAPGIAVRPIKSLSGSTDFNEVFFDNVLIPAENLIGAINNAWRQATEELSYERSGSDRFLETFGVLQELAHYVEAKPSAHLKESLGVLVAELYTLRQMSLSVALMLEEGKIPEIEAALVKDVGTIWQQSLPERVRSFVAGEGDLDDHPLLRQAIADMLKIAPRFTIQGGTTEILRGIIARGLGLR